MSHMSLLAQWNILKLANILHYNLEFFNRKCKISHDYSEIAHHSVFIKFLFFESRDIILTILETYKYCYLFA